jgi:hypothetical protein
VPARNSRRSSESLGVREGVVLRTKEAAAIMEQNREGLRQMGLEGRAPFTYH